MRASSCSWRPLGYAGCLSLQNLGEGFCMSVAMGCLSMLPDWLSYARAT